LALVAGLDEEAGRMPPDGEGTPLTPEQVALLRAWIEQGATWPDEADAAVVRSKHWSFQPITPPPLPAVRDSAWVINPVDAFILARLEREGIMPSPEADRATLIRRLHLDLIGLPPTPAETEAFMHDHSPDAYERLVDRVLASPHYGERWGRHWLDLARYADSDGYEKDLPRPHAWRYRHWVIEAINEDLPYDRFSILQIAGDMLPDAGTEEKVATGFHRNTLHNTEGGTDQEEDRVKKTVDRTNTVGAIWLGLTLGCAQCHSHKYDPLTQREYYQLYAFFNSINEVNIDAALPPEQQRYEQARAAFDQEHAKLTAAMTAYEQNNLADAQRAWERTALEGALIWRPIEAIRATSKHGARLEKKADGSLLASGTNRVSDVYEIETVATEPITAVRLEVLPDESLAQQGPGRADNGNFVLTTFQVFASPPNQSQPPRAVELSHAQADFAQKSWEIAKAINDNPGDGWAVSPEFGQRHVATFEFQQPVSFEGGAALTFVLDQMYDQAKPHNLGRFRLSLTDARQPITLEGLLAPVAEALQRPAEQRSPDQLQQIAEFYKSVDPELVRLKQVVAAHARRKPPSPGVQAQAVTQLADPRETRIHVRGDFLNKGEVVHPLPPSFLHGLTTNAGTPNRLDFANWLFAEENPLLARVTVNRIWQQIFGRGIVETVDDFGAQGDQPSHPELLDWLAIAFREQHWSVKQLQRLLVTSRTYRQSSVFRPELAQIDPDNEWLARQQRRRVEAELIRDLALAASGLLDARLGGLSVRPPQPAEYSALTYADSAKWQASQGGDAYRRGLYTFFQRTSPYPMLITFDSPDATECCARRELSNTPLQALTLWNDPVFYECARSLAARVVRDIPPTADASQTVSQRASYLFRVCLSRAPAAEELAEVTDLYLQQRSWLQTDAARASEIVGGATMAPNSSAAELAAWTIVGRTIMNLDEFITRE